MGDGSGGRQRRARAVVSWVVSDGRWVEGGLKKKPQGMKPGGLDKELAGLFMLFLMVESVRDGKRECCKRCIVWGRDREWIMID